MVVLDHADLTASSSSAHVGLPASYWRSHPGLALRLIVHNKRRNGECLKSDDTQPESACSFYFTPHPYPTIPAKLLNGVETMVKFAKRHWTEGESESSTETGI
mmetsp:Transcript_104221/g.179632  ORF Transcript_104221/g.179632 Transcript_104221/m.179632 type:complete len:103 (+) Transcript_104221:1251-1559(+)